MTEKQIFTRIWRQSTLVTVVFLLVEKPSLVEGATHHYSLSVFRTYVPIRIQIHAPLGRRNQNQKKKVVKPHPLHTPLQLFIRNKKKDFWFSWYTRFTHRVSFLFPQSQTPPATKQLVVVAQNTTNREKKNSN